MLVCSGTNIKMLHDPNGQLTTLQSGAYLERQFHQSLKRAYNPQRRYQAQSIIISFSNHEFDTSNLEKQASQALRLVQGYVHQYFSDSQSVTCVQCDGDGGKLHVHLLINSVKTSGKTVPTNRFSVYRMRTDFNRYLEQNFQRVTGRKWINSFKKSAIRQDTKSITTRSGWEKQLKRTIDRIKREVRTVTDFLDRLSSQGIKVQERGKKKRWTYTQIVSARDGKPKLKRVRAFYQRKDKNGNVLSTRGLGQEYTKQGLEQYWQQQKEKEQVLVPTPGHNRKEADNREQSNVQTEREELIKVRTLAREAQAAANRREQRIQLTLRQLRAAEARERKQRGKSEVGSVAKGQRNQGRSQSAGQQRRHAEVAQRHVREQQERAKRTNGKDVEPDI